MFKPLIVTDSWDDITGDSHIRTDMGWLAVVYARALGLDEIPTDEWMQNNIHQVEMDLYNVSQRDKETVVHLSTKSMDVATVRDLLMTTEEFRVAGNLRVVTTVHRDQIKIPGVLYFTDASKLMATLSFGRY